MNQDEILEGEFTESAPAVRSENANQVDVFNPLDAQPAAFAKNLEIRRNNYDNLKLHLQSVLVPGTDFGKLHIKKDCKVWGCKDPYHLTGWQLLAPGADKILGILGLAVEYPGVDGYMQACREGRKLEEIIASCHVLGHNGQVICDGMGACERREMKGSLNNTIKRACKRARLDAVKRLPVVSALFEDDFFDGMADQAQRQGPPSAAKRAQRVVNPWDTGAELEVCPVGNEIKGKKWRDIPTVALEYLVENMNDKPDILRAAARELDKRSDRTPTSSSTHTSPAPTSPADPAEEYFGN